MRTYSERAPAGGTRVSAVAVCDSCKRSSGLRQWAGTCDPERVELAAREDAARQARDHGWAYVDGRWCCVACAALEPCAPVVVCA